MRGGMQTVSRVELDNATISIQLERVSRDDGLLIWRFSRRPSGTSPTSTGASATVWSGTGCLPSSSRRGSWGSRSGSGSGCSCSPARRC